jgi:TPR repeat protein
MNLAIEGGCYSPFYTLGNMYEDGDAVPKVDYESALNYYRMAASFNHPQAFFKLSQ